MRLSATTVAVSLVAPLTLAPQTPSPSSHVCCRRSLRPHRVSTTPGHRSDPRQAEIHDAHRRAPTEKIMEAATGDKDFWVVDVVGSFCFVHPAKQGISSNLNLITDKGNIYSFTLQDVSGTAQLRISK